MYSLLKRLLVSQSSRVGPERADRELAFLFKWYNDRIDELRGIRKQDFMWGRTWSELKAEELWTNIKGPSPGGNQHIPQGAAAGSSSQVVEKCLASSYFWSEKHARVLDSFVFRGGPQQEARGCFSLCITSVLEPNSLGWSV